MAKTTQQRKIKCPHCGWIRTMTIEVDDKGAIVVRGGEALTDAGQRIKDMLSDAALTEANAWIDMPKCPNPDCQKVYQYNVRTGNTRP